MSSPTETPAGTGSSGTYYFLDGHIAAYGRAYESGVVGGLAVTASSPESLVLNIEAGEFHQGPVYELNRSYPGGTVTIPTADADRLRCDIVSIYWDGADAQVLVTASTRPDNSTPIPNNEPPMSNGDRFNVVIATVMVYPAATAVPDSLIYDRRFFLPFFFSGDSGYIATSTESHGSASEGDVVIWDAANNLAQSGRNILSMGDIVDSSIGAVPGQVALYYAEKSIYNETATGRPLLTAGVQSVAPINLASEVTGDLPLASIVPATAASRLLLRGAASGAGDWQEGTIGSGLSLSGTVLSATGGGGGGGVTMYNNTAAPLTINTTTAETTLYSFTIAAGDLGTTKNMRVTLRGTYLANNGSPTFTFRVKLGATTLWGDASVGMGAMSARGVWSMDFILANLNTANSQALNGIFTASNRSATASIAGIGDIAASGLLISPFGTSTPATEDTTAALVLAVTVQPSISHVNVEIARQISFAELIG